jgi:hypothetical protein
MNVKLENDIKLFVLRGRRKEKENIRPLHVSHAILDFEWTEVGRRPYSLQCK